MVRHGCNLEEIRADPSFEREAWLKRDGFATRARLCFRQYRIAIARVIWRSFTLIEELDSAASEAQAASGRALRARNDVRKLDSLRRDNT